MRNTMSHKHNPLFVDVENRIVCLCFQFHLQEVQKYSRWLQSALACCALYSPSSIFHCGSELVSMSAHRPSTLKRKLVPPVGQWPCSHCKSDSFPKSDLEARLQGIKSDLLRLHIGALRLPICVGSYGNDVGISTCTGDAVCTLKINRDVRRRWSDYSW